MHDGDTDTDFIDDVLGWIVARLWRKRIELREAKDTAWKAEFMAWHRENPNRCRYCAYTNWANQKRGLKLKLKLQPHDCLEGKSPVVLPRATLLRRSP